MTLEEFIDDYSLRRAKEMQSEMLAAGNRRPKKWTFLKETEEGTSKLIVDFFGCPFKLKSSGMVDWLRALLLLEKLSDNESGFSAEDLLVIGIASMDIQLEGNFWVIYPIGFVQKLAELIVNLERPEEHLELFVWLKTQLGERFQNDDQPEEIHWDCWRSVLLCSLYTINFSIKYSQITAQTFDALSQLRYALDGGIDEAKENGEFPDFSLENEYFTLLMKMIPKIESSGEQELIRGVYEFARDYYQATRRYSLADEYVSKLSIQV